MSQIDVEAEPTMAAGSGDRPERGPPDTANLLLRSLSPQDAALLVPHLERVSVPNGTLLAEAGAAIDVVLFPENGVAGFLDVLEDGRRVAVGLVGCEGLVGYPLIMGDDRWPHEVVARGCDGTALAVAAGALGHALRLGPGLHRQLLRYAATFVTQVTSTAVSNLIQSTEQRTARWLLLYHDRIDGDELIVTHEELGAMLGVRRASITDALHQLEGAGAIRGHRGRVLIRDRVALASLAADTYGRAEAEYERLIGSEGHRHN